MKKRLDILLVEKGLCDSRTRAQALVMEGKVRVAGQVERKASRQVEDAATTCPAVTRSPCLTLIETSFPIVGAFTLADSDASTLPT